MPTGKNLKNVPNIYPGDPVRYSLRGRHQRLYQECMCEAFITARLITARDGSGGGMDVQLRERGQVDYVRPHCEGFCHQENGATSEC